MLEVLRRNGYPRWIQTSPTGGNKFRSAQKVGSENGGGAPRLVEGAGLPLSLAAFEALHHTSQILTLSFISLLYDMTSSAPHATTDAEATTELNEGRHSASTEAPINAEPVVDGPSDVASHQQLPMITASTGGHKKRKEAGGDGQPPKRVESSFLSRALPSSPEPEAGDALEETSPAA
jgi:hypothetical protein